ncbi:MAG TPA: regulatory protein GemA [Chitinispirillaceae bacterium]|jgi:hypothetical protein|nr:regulatory protein GemA [Chitinispirillaceae bacterium]
MISLRQVKAVHALKSRLGFSDDDYRHLLVSNYNVDSSKDLTFNQARELIDSLVRMGIKEGKIVPAGEDRPGLCTKKQAGMLLAIWREVSFLPAGEQHAVFDKFIRNRFGVGCLKWLPKEMVGKVRHTLLAMKNAKEKNVCDNK